MKFEKKSKPVYQSEFGRSIRRLLAYKGLSVPEAIEWRGSMARALKSRKKREA